MKLFIERETRIMQILQSIDREFYVLCHLRLKNQLLRAILYQNTAWFLATYYLFTLSTSSSVEHKPVIIRIIPVAIQWKQMMIFLEEDKRISNQSLSELQR